MSDLAGAAGIPFVPLKLSMPSIDRNCENRTMALDFGARRRKRLGSSLQAMSCGQVQPKGMEGHLFEGLLALRGATNFSCWSSLPTDASPAKLVFCVTVMMWSRDSGNKIPETAFWKQNSGN